MVYRNLECDNEKTWRWHTINDIYLAASPIFKSVIKQVKEDVKKALEQCKDIGVDVAASALEKYIPKIKGIQTIYCPSCEHLQIDAIIDDQTKIREDLWRSYEVERFIKSVRGA